MANEDLRTAQAGKNDEFYTQFHDIEVEMNAFLEYDPDVLSWNIGKRFSSRKSRKYLKINLEQ